LIAFWIDRLLRRQMPVGVASPRAPGESAKVNHVFQPDGLLVESNPPYALVQISLHASNEDDLSDLRAHSKDTRFETAENRVSVGIVQDLICISNEAYEDLLLEKLRSAPIEMKVNAALNLLVRILEIVSKPRNIRKGVSCHRIQIGIAASAIDGTMTEAKIGDAIWIIGADGMSPVA
jgi:hypothetical protein